MVRPTVLSSEAFTIRPAFFYTGAFLFALGALGGLVADGFPRFSLPVLLDFFNLVVLFLALGALRFGGWSLSAATALLLYAGSVTFVVTPFQALLLGTLPPDLTVYNNLFLLALFLALATFLAGPGGTLFVGASMLVLMLFAAFVLGVPLVRANLWFEVPAVTAAMVLLHWYRRSLDRVLADLQRAVRENSALRERERLAALGELTAGIAHEIRNPLNLVVNFAESSRQLLDELEASWAAAEPTEADLHERAYLLAELRQNMEDVRAQGLRGSAIVQTMLLHARSGGGPSTVIDLNEVVREGFHLATLGFPRPAVEAVERVLSATPVPVPVRGVRSDLSRAVVNLCSNALWSVLERHGPGGTGDRPRVEVSVSVEENRARVVVRDNGVGFSPEVRNRLFTPFYTTKVPGKGTGLGLSLAREVIVDEHGGTVDAEGEPGVGAVFTVTLPVAPPETPENPPQ